MIVRSILAIVVAAGLLCLSTGTTWSGQKEKGTKSPATTEVKGKTGSADGCCMAGTKASKGTKEGCDAAKGGKEGCDAEKGAKASKVKDDKAGGCCDDDGAEVKSSAPATPEKK